MLARRKLLGILASTWTAQAIYAVCKLGVPDLVAEGPATASALAAATGADEVALTRLLRALCGAGIFTQPAHRGYGYATIAVAHLIREIEATGYNTYWNCSKRNLASAAVARKLGYRVQKEYRCMVWNKIG